MTQILAVIQITILLSSQTHLPFKTVKCKTS